VTPSYLDSYTTVAPPAGSYQPIYPSATAEPNTSAHITLEAPADARVWFDGTATKSTGPVREFYTPPLTPGSHYRYDVRAQWNENGHEVTQTQQVEVTPGAQAIVNFTIPTKTAGEGSAAKNR
jgi:uncharacterized protein (TIGR03000 family)